MSLIPDSSCEAIAGIVTRLVSRSLAVLSSFIDVQEPCALIGFHEYQNVGDHAIWLGQRELLRRLNVSLVYAAGRSTFSEATLRARMPRGTILLQGGGNFGDLWGRPLCEKILPMFPTYRVVQLPQSICFLDPKNLERTKSVIRRHPNFALMVRDQKSFEIAAQHLDTALALCPDLAIGLGPLPRVRKPIIDVLWLGRDDRESAERFMPALPPNHESADWGMVRDGFARKAALKLIRAWQGLSPQALRIAVKLSTFDAIAWRRLRFGLRLLEKARVVVTNRLHGHILSLLSATPHILIGDRYGKIESFYRTWTQSVASARFVNSGEEAINAATQML
jgi:exopolysaccharide biosynthesis predicted pyruvyltransferase EpsI